MKLSDFDHLRADPRVVFKEEEVGGKAVVIVSYMIADKEFWQKPLALETRGATFCAETGECLARPFEKFFNVGEREDTLIHRINFDGARVFEKRDGSMITPVLINGGVFLKSKKSFFSEVAKKAQESASPQLLEFCRVFCEQGLTPIFEFTHPECRVVLDYGSEPKFVLLAVRHNGTGEYVDISSVKPIAECYNVGIIEEYELSTDEILHHMKTRKNFEGYVVNLKDGRRVKFKTEWYLRNHRVQTELRVRDIAEAVADEVIDDMKSSLSLEGKDLAPVEEIERQVVAEIDKIRADTEELLSQIRALPSRKEAAAKFGRNENFGLAMKLYDGKEVNYAKAWKSRHLGQVSLRAVYSSNF